MNRLVCLLTVTLVLVSSVSRQARAISNPTGAVSASRPALASGRAGAAAPASGATPPGAEDSLRSDDRENGKRWTMSLGVLPVVVVSDAIIHLVWVGNHSVRYKRSANAGKNWSEEQVLAADDKIDNFGIRPSLAAHKGVVLVAWAERGPVFRGRMSRDAGLSWEAPWDFGRAESVSLAVDTSASVYAILAGNHGVWCRAIALPDGAWSSPVRITALDTGWTAVAANAYHARLHVGVWNFGRTSLRREILYLRSKSGCRGWDQPVPLAPSIERRTLLQDVGEIHPAIAVSGQQVFVLWSDLPGEDGRSGRQTMFVRSSPDQGSTWQASTKIESSPRSSHLTAKGVAFDGSKIHVVSNLGYWQSGDAGKTWSSARPAWAGESIATDRRLTIVVGVEQTPAGSSIFHVPVR